MPTDHESTTDRLLGLGPVARAAALSTGRKLRILALHGVPDRAGFRRQLAQITENYRPVSGAQVADAFHGGPALPPRAVWVTFDDGRSDVVTEGLPELRAAGVPATMFVCPGLILEGQPFWWDAVTTSLTAAGPFEWSGRTWNDRALVMALKKVPDAERRAVVSALTARIDAGSGPASQPAGAAVLTVEQLDEWRSAGNEIGNHTWDHPCLDQCPEDAQRDQVIRAHEALVGLLGEPPDLFAYPNGDWATAAEGALEELGYRIGLLFDHRLTATDQPPLRLSRLKLDSDAPPRRTAAVLSGGHSTMFQARATVAAKVGSARG